MILIISTKQDVHVDAVIPHLNAQHVPFIRLNTEDLPQKTDIVWEQHGTETKAILRLYDTHEVDLSQITAVWYRKPYPAEVSKKLKTKQAISYVQNESAAFLEGLYTYLSDRFWINFPPYVDQAKHKLSNLSLAANIGFEIPHTLITTNPEAAKEFYKKNNGNVVTKMLSNYAYVDKFNYYPIWTSKVSPADLEKIDDVIFAPTQLQEYIEKKVELRVTIVDKHVFSCEIHSQNSEKTKIDWRNYDFENVMHREHPLPKTLEKKCFAMLKKLNLNFGAFDFVVTPDDRYVFIELNPNGQYLWIEMLTKMPISKAIADLLIAGQKHYQAV